MLPLIGWLETHQRHAAWLAAAALVALGCVVYGQTLSRGWVVAPPDDLEWLSMVRGASPADVPSWFVKQPAFFYRPLARVSFYLDYLVWGDNPFGFRLTHLVLYIIAAIALAWLAYEVTRSRLAGFFAACLYEVYPGNWETAYWISTRADLLAAVFVFAALALLLRARRKRRLGLWLGALGCTLAALFSKETGLALVPIVLVWAAIRSPRLRRSGRHWAWTGITLAVLLTMVAGYWALRSEATQMGTQHLARFEHGQLHLRKVIVTGADWWWRPIFIQLYPMVKGAAPGFATLLVEPVRFFDFWGTLALWAGALLLIFRRDARAAAMLLVFYPLAALPASGEAATVPFRRFYYLPAAGGEAVTAFVCWCVLVWCRERWGRWGWLATGLFAALAAEYIWRTAHIIAPLGQRLFGR